MTESLESKYTKQLSEIEEERYESRVIRIQSLTRAFLARKRAKRLQEEKEATTTSSGKSGADPSDQSAQEVTAPLTREERAARGRERWQKEKSGEYRERLENHIDDKSCAEGFVSNGQAPICVNCGRHAVKHVTHYPDAKRVRVPMPEPIDTQRASLIVLEVHTRLSAIEARLRREGYVYGDGHASVVREPTKKRSKKSKRARASNPSTSVLSSTSTSLNRLPMLKHDPTKVLSTSASKTTSMTSSSSESASQESSAKDSADKKGVAKGSVVKGDEEDELDAEGGDVEMRELSSEVDSSSTSPLSSDNSEEEGSLSSESLSDGGTTLIDARAAAAGGDWICPSCTLRNDALDMLCCTCDTVRPGLLVGQSLATVLTSRQDWHEMVAPEEEKLHSSANTFDTSDTSETQRRDLASILLRKQPVVTSAPAPALYTLEQCPIAQWVRDEEVRQCSNEKCAAPLGFFKHGRRKWHCRACGNVFCDQCTRFRMRLISDPIMRTLTSPERVCLACLLRARQLQKGATDARFSPRSTDGSNNANVSFSSSSDSDEAEVRTGAGTSVDRRVSNRSSKSSAIKQNADVADDEEDVDVLYASKPAWLRAALDAHIRRDRGAVQRRLALLTREQRDEFKAVLAERRERRKRRERQRGRESERREGKKEEASASSGSAGSSGGGGGGKKRRRHRKENDSSTEKTKTETSDGDAATSKVTKVVEDVKEKSEKSEKDKSEKTEKTESRLPSTSTSTLKSSTSQASKVSISEWLLLKDEDELARRWHAYVGDASDEVHALRRLLDLADRIGDEETDEERNARRRRRSARSSDSSTSTSFDRSTSTQTNADEPNVGRAVRVSNESLSALKRQYPVVFRVPPRKYRDHEDADDELDSAAVKERLRAQLLRRIEERERELGLRTEADESAPSVSPSATSLLDSGAGTDDKSVASGLQIDALKADEEYDGDGSGGGGKVLVRLSSSGRRYTIEEHDVVADPSLGVPSHLTNVQSDDVIADKETAAADDVASLEISVETVGAQLSSPSPPLQSPESTSDNGKETEKEKNVKHVMNTDITDEMPIGSNPMASISFVASDEDEL